MGSSTISGLEIGPRFKELIQGEGAEAELYRACVYGESQRVRELLETDSRLVTLETNGPRGNPRWTPMLVACICGHRDVMEVLFELGMPLDRAWQPQTLLHYAAEHGHAPVVEWLIQRGVNVNALAANYSGKLTPLLNNLFRAKGGDEQVVRLLLQAGADPEIRTGDYSALSTAAGQGDIPVVKVLLEFGADVNTPTGQFDASWSRPYSDDWPIVEQSWNETRPLYGAVCTGSHELVNFLLDCGADIDALSFGWTALHAAAGQGNCQMVELLLARGADIRTKSSNGKTAIDLLVGHKRSAELLREAMDKNRANALK